MKKEIEELAKGMKVPIFADRGSDIKAALDYGYEIAEACGDAKIHVITAMHVLMNTISNMVIDISSYANTTQTGIAEQLLSDITYVKDILCGRCEFGSEGDCDGCLLDAEPRIHFSPKAMEEGKNNEEA